MKIDKKKEKEVKREAADCQNEVTAEQECRNQNSFVGAGEEGSITSSG